MSMAYYNEFDKGAALWLRELISAGHIAPGDVDERSIEDVRPDELAGYTQCHFFAGIGGWSLALRLAGWPDHRPIWTGSCPCQPFSAAGKGAGFNDERHLWPHFQWLIQQCAPATVFGEQVASKSTGPWFDLVQADLEAMGYAFGLVPFPAASVGAPQIRDRAYWVGHSISAGLEGFTGDGDNSEGRQEQAGSASQAGGNGGLADPNGRQQPGEPIIQGAESDRKDPGRRESVSEPKSCGDLQRLADSSERGRGKECSHPGGGHAGDRAEGLAAGLGTGCCDCGMGDTNSESARGHTRASLEAEGRDGGGAVGDLSLPPGADDRPGPTNGFWGAADWLHCRDEKWRPVEPGTFPLVDGLPRGVVPDGDPSLPSAEARVMRLKGYGNAIVPEQAAEFIRVYSA